MKKAWHSSGRGFFNLQLGWQPGHVKTPKISHSQVSFGRLRSSFSARTCGTCFMAQVLIRARDGWSKSVLFMVSFLILPCQVFFSDFPCSIQKIWWRVQASFTNHGELHWTMQMVCGNFCWSIFVIFGKLSRCISPVLFMKRCRVIFPGSFVDLFLVQNINTLTDYSREEQFL